MHFSCLRVLASETWKQAAIVRKKGHADQQKRREDVPGMLARSEGRLWSRCLIRSVSTRSASLVSLHCHCCSGKKIEIEQKKRLLCKINCWYQSRASPPSFCAYVWPPVHPLMWTSFFSVAELACNVIFLSLHLIIFLHHMLQYYSI